jgi:hypothetical protein
MAKPIPGPDGAPPNSLEQWLPKDDQSYEGRGKFEPISARPA